MNRREFLIGSTALGVSVASPIQAQGATRALPLPPLTDLVDGIGNRVPLLLAPSTHDFGNGAISQTFGINSSYLGPVIRAQQGQTLPLDVTNTIGDVVALHWHGLHVPGSVDGGPHQEIEDGGTWSPDVFIDQRASMNWFHSHTHGKTARQTYNGLAGVLLVEDEASLSADLPKTYGTDDFTIILQDKAFNGAGEMAYQLTGEIFEDGFQGETLVVNGAIAPVMQAVPDGLVRLRILNACNARFLQLSMESGPLFVIASDGGFLASTVETASIVMSPGERYEILVDMGAAQSNALVVDLDGGNGGFLASLLGGRNQTTAITLTQNGETGFQGSIPNRLANLSPPDPTEATVTRSFELQMDTGADLAALALAWGNICGNGAMAINGRPMNMDRIDEEVRKGETEVWRISVDDQLHPFHIHGCSFRILSQHGAEPPSYAQGWKDMVHVEEGWSEVLVTFNHEATVDTPYMYHCHILEHEDCGMMGQFTVT